MNSQELWQAILGEMELLISKASFTAWFKQTFIYAYEKDKEIIIGVPNAYTKSWFEKKYTDPLKKVIKEITGKKNIKISYKITSEKNKDLVTKTKKEFYHQPQEKQSSSNHSNNNLNPKYTFENFIIGKGNELAHAASKAIIKKPGEAYNPLFIYGGVGLGKTHLIQAVGNAIVKKYSQKKVIYIPCENFINDFLNALSSNKTDRFKEKYRNIDVLLVDDIQFLSGKEQTQEAFFHTFNELHQTNKQIILTSDRPPKSIPTLEDRLISRFEWGMIADISLPDIETRSAILKYKAKEKNFKLNNDIINLIATHITNNIRELEGVLNKIIAFHEISNQEPTIDSVQQIITTITKPISNSNITSDNVLKIVADFYNIKINQLTSSCRKKDLVIPRQIAMYLLKEELNYSFPVIAQELNKKDHTTVIYAYNKIKKEKEINEQLNQKINLIKERIYNNF